MLSLQLLTPGRGVQASSWTPADLSPGALAWYDPSDLASLFQDTAGTVPVTASGQPVARNWMRARAWLEWGAPIAIGALGAVAVIKRGDNPTQGHVGFVAGWDAGGRLLLLGGNQGNEVNISAFGPDRLLGYRWPLGLPAPELPAPRLTHVAQLSAGEA